jgi:hypothetical protein
VDFTTEYSLQSVWALKLNLAMTMNKNPKHLYDEQQTLIAEIERHMKSGNAAKIFGAAISMMNLMEGVIASKGKGANPTMDADIALAGVRRFLERLQSSDEKELMIAEGLSRSSSLQGPGEWGAKVVRVIIQAEYLLLKSPSSFGVMAEVSARDLISNLQRMSLIGPTDEASTVPIFDIQVSDWFHRRAHGASKRGRPMVTADTEELGIVSLSVGQDQFAKEIEALSDAEAKDAYAALVSCVHQMRRMKANLGMPIAIDDIEVFLKSFDSYVNRLDVLDSEELHEDYAVLRRCMVDGSRASNLRHGAQALMVIILGEMIRREGIEAKEHRMSGYQRAHQMLERLEHSLSTRGEDG